MSKHAKINNFYNQLMKSSKKSFEEPPNSLRIELRT